MSGPAALLMLIFLIMEVTWCYTSGCDGCLVLLLLEVSKCAKKLFKVSRRAESWQVNERLTKINSDIARQERFLRNQKKIQSTWTTNFRVFIKLNGSLEEAKILLIRQIEELDKYQ
ncbi:hypothetical protein GOODEAATRI_031920 [Goodea atripinnis]|uniref:Uncharacterized protein n=1 Tax=Goodea atripinnis TaxID=208336 RepID=A0ABV0N5X6_9TELE